nr:terpene synthase family protein [Streptomyces boncukensis]
MFAYLDAAQRGEENAEHHGDSPAARALADQVSWTTRMSPDWRLRLLNNLRDYLSAYVTEAYYRRLNVVLPVENLLVHRRVCMAMEPSFDFIERVASGELADDARRALRPLADCTSDVLGAVNDVASYAREASHGDVHNLVMAFSREKGVTVTEAAQATVEFGNRRIRDLEFLTEQIHAHLPPDQRSMAEKFTENCRTWIRGYYEWALITHRFLVADH